MMTKKPGVRIPGPGDGAGFVGRNDVWNVYLFGMSRVGRWTYWHLSIVGHHRAHTLTVKATGGIWSLTPPDELLAAVQEWLVSGRRNELAFADPAWS